MSFNLRTPLRALAFAICALPALASAADGSLSLGVSLPLSGDSAAEGKDIAAMLRFANARIGGGRYRLIVEDDKCSNKEAATIAQKLAAVDHVHGVIGFACSGAVLAAAPIYEKFKTPTVAVATGAPALSAAGDYIYRTIPSLSTAAAKLYDHAAARYTKIGVLSEDTAYAQGLATAFMEHAKDGRLQVIAETYLPGVADFKTPLAKLRAAGVEAVFLNPQAEPGYILLFGQMRQLGWDAPVYGAYYPGFAEFKKTYGSKADGIVYADLPTLGAAIDRSGAELYADYVRENGKPASSEFYFVTTLAAFQALHEALSQRKETVKGYLDGHSFKGIVGDFSFDNNGDVQGERLTFVLKTLRNGEPAGLPSP